MSDRPEDKRIDEAQIAQDFETIERVRRIAWQRNPQDLLALIERLRVQLLTEDMPRRRRQYLRALIDYYEEVLDERLAKLDAPDRKTLRKSVREYIRDLIGSLDD